MAVTIKQIAKLAGVSRGTVDRVLHNRGGVKEDVADRVLEIARELEYEPNFAAKILANSKNAATIGVIMNSGENPFFKKVFLGIKLATSEIKQTNTKLIIKELTGYDADAQLAAIEEMAQLPLNGLAITPINDKRIIKRLNALSESGISIVTFNVDITGLKKLCFVGCNYKRSGQVAAELMGKMAHTGVNVAIVSGSRSMQGHKERADGFCEAAGEYPNLNIISVVYCDDSDEKAYSLTKQLIKDGAQAFYFCAGGIDGGMKAVSELPHAMVITVDDTQNICEYLKEGLASATVCQQPVKQGHDAIYLLNQWLVNGKRPPRVHNYTQNEIKMKYNLD